MKNNIRMNAEYIEYRSKKVFLVGKNGKRYSRKDIEKICGISERKQKDLIETNKPMKGGIYCWRTENFMKLCELLGTTIEDLINKEDYIIVAEDIKTAIEKAESEGHKRKPR